MTPRAIVLGLVGVLFVCSYTYFNDAVIHQTMFVGNNMPISVYGGLVLFVLLLNPLLARVGRRLAFSERELTVVLVMTLSSCCIPGSGLMRTFTSTLLLPHHYARTNPGWQSQHVLEMVPAPMLVDVSAGEDMVVNGFVQGAAAAGSNIAFWQVPWASWASCLLFWLPLILSFWLALIGLSLVVHRQWAEHERLPYPIAEFAHALLPRDQGARSSLFRDPLFWAGVLPVMLIHLNNYAVQCLPAKLIEIRTTLNFSSLAQYLETLSQGGAWFLFWPRIYFTAVAFAYFLATDVSLSLGLGPIAYAFVVGKLRRYGISVELPES